VSDKICWGIFREEAHSPGREFDDSEVLRLTGKHLEARGFHVNLRTPQEVVQTEERCAPFVFLMCERVAILERLQQWVHGGAVQVNSPTAVLNTYRHLMIPLFTRAGLSSPASTLVSTHSSVGQRSRPCWVKRGDVHNTQDGDVMFARNGDEADLFLSRLARRGIHQAVIQEHVPGDLIKFYGVGGSDSRNHQEPWFRWFYHKDQQLAGHPFQPEDLKKLARQAASILGLEIFGGDAIATREGKLMLIDLNAWPSFALCRDEAAECIAAYLADRFRRGQC